MQLTEAAHSHETVPMFIRIVLWAAIAMALLMAIGVGIALLAGNSAKGASLLRTFCLCFAAAMLVQGGYVLAPFAIGRTWWPLAFWWMLPIAIMAVVVATMPVIGAIRWTRPDGASGWKTIASMGWFTAIGFVVYVAPPIAMWVYRPTPAA